MLIKYYLFDKIGYWNRQKKFIRVEIYNSKLVVMDGD
ncbi:hypothetical protein JOC48_002114 [Aquibacillus albus]|uniref:Uncharacterized protein n=1 Tax=Aquibacillus albus TaxID=1168171 RepID=A0ABS2N0I6_9BACI|nr:hypothetical protein [Aquibacillus albus]